MVWFELRHSFFWRGAWGRAREAVGGRGKNKHPFPYKKRKEKKAFLQTSLILISLCLYLSFPFSCFPDDDSRTRD